METENNNETVDYDLSVIELTEFYKELCNLFELKKKMVNEFYEKYSYDESLFIDYLLTRKIEDILK